MLGRLDPERALPLRKTRLARGLYLLTVEITDCDYVLGCCLGLEPELQRNSALSGCRFLLFVNLRGGFTY